MNGVAVHFRSCAGSVHTGMEKGRTAMKTDILYEDDVILVCRKPAGTAVQTRSLTQPDMESLLKNYCKSRGADGGPSGIFVVHRLDQPVEGVMVFARTKEAAASLSRQFSDRRADKFYYAMTDGIPQVRKGRLEDELLRDAAANLSRVVPRGTAGAKHAELFYEVVETGNGRAVLRIRLETGRHHQIRVQLAHAGWPVAGDRKYNFKEHICPSLPHLALCSYKIGIRHPVTHRKLEFEIDKPFTLS